MHTYIYIRTLIFLQVIGEYRTTHPHLVALIDNCYTLGVIMGTPRACLRAETILADPSCTFLSFDVAQLTASTFGCSREDSEKFFSVYKYEKIYLVSLTCRLYEG